MKTTNCLLAGLLLSALALSARAGSDSYSGHIAFHNDVAFHSITITTPLSNLEVWSDSYINGANFDPIVAVWHNGNLIAQNDDFSQVDLNNQTARDSGIRLYNLGVGTYVFTVAAYGNFATGPKFTFARDSDLPIPLDSWCQPANHCDMAKHFSLHWSVTSH